MKTVLFATVAALATTIAAADRPPSQGQDHDNYDRRGGSQIVITVNGLNCATDAGASAFAARSWSWGAMNSGSLSSGAGGGSGKASVSNLMVKKSFDACSPLLLTAVVTGRHLNTLKLEQTDWNGNPVATVTLTEVIVSAWNVGSTEHDADPDESVSFSFRKVCVATGSSQSCFDTATLATS